MKNVYKLLGNIALTFRLSLDDLSDLTCKDKDLLYDEILKVDNTQKESYKYLFNYEAVTVSSDESKRSKFLASVFLNKLNKALNEKDNEKINPLLNELNKVDNSLFALASKKKCIDEYTKDDCLIVSKYRLKYSLSVKKICEFLNIGVSKIHDFEKGLDDKYLKNRLLILNDFFADVMTDNIMKKVNK